VAERRRATGRAQPAFHAIIGHPGCPDAAQRGPAARRIVNGRGKSVMFLESVSAIMSALHLLALGIGLPAVYLRGRALKGALDGRGLRRLFVTDTVWGVAAVVWLVTGLLRAFTGLERGSEFYLHSSLFWTKMALILVVSVLEIWPMLTFIRWRRAIGKGQEFDASRVRSLFMVSHIQLALVVIIVFVAAFMARGFGYE
jgi:putative membrane protein